MYDLYEPFMATTPRNRICQSEECKRTNHRRKERKAKERRLAGEPPQNEAKMWDVNDFSDPYQVLTTPLTEFPGGHAMYHPLS